VAHRIEALDQLEKQRAALLRSVSHDLRTPLSAIRASVSELEDGSMYDDATRTRLLYLVGEETDRLDRLVANLLSLARIEGGGLSPRRVAVDLPELVRLCTHRLDRVLDDIEVRIDAPTDLPTVFADHTLVEQVVTNLLENAARHSPPGTPIIVRLRALRKTVELAVIDHGAGVRAGDSKVIFEPFRSGTSGGTSGIGLAICKAVVEAHGGTIGVDETPGGGATFTVRLPIG
jgi:two-component system sensor histidine kinase KdpD